MQTIAPPPGSAPPPSFLPAPEAPSGPRRAPAPDGNVLVVEDDLGLLRLIEKSLRREKITVRTASTGREALDLLKAEAVELLLLDLKLEDLQGPQLIARLLEIRGPIPFIIMTGQGDERVAVEMMKQGALDYLVKDSDFLELLPTRVSRALQQLEKDRLFARAEEALRKEHAFSSALLNISGALIVATDREGKIVRFNPACERITGYSSAEVMGRDCLQLFIPPEELPDVKTIFGRLRGGEMHNEFENHWLTRSGERRLIRWSNATLLNSKGEPEYIIATGLDLTEHRRLEEQILQISELEKRNIGHDLHDGICQYLAGIELMSQVLQQNVEKKSKPLAAQAAQIAEHVREAVSQARMLARGLSPVVLESEGLMSALQELTTSTERLHRITCSFRCPTPVLITDDAIATHLYRIAQEAVSNAVKHARATEIEITLGIQEGRVVLRVSDDGHGLREAAKSNGMGLHIMRYRAGIIGGSLFVASEPEGGTTVSCSLPVRAGIASPLS